MRVKPSSRDSSTSIESPGSTNRAVFRSFGTSTDIRSSFSHRIFIFREYDLYIEVTVAKPARNTSKNRKLRLLRSHHPLVNVKLFTRRDVERVFSRAMKRAS